MSILIAHASAGCGHKSAAVAVADVAKANGCDDVLLIDALDYASYSYRVTYARVYVFLVKYLPSVWALCYHLCDNPVIYWFIRKVRRVVNVINAGSLMRLMKERDPEFMVFTHFFPLDIAISLKKRGLIKSKIITVVTDFFAHSFWVYPEVDTYIVASDASRDYLVARGIEHTRICVMGIPIHERFSQPVDKAGVRDELGLVSHKKTVLICGGGFGGGPVEAVVNELIRRVSDCQALVVCGSNRTLKKRLDESIGAHNDRIKVLGYVKNMHELMAVSDCIITKAGGLTSSEALAKQLPLILIRPIPGQESGNCRILVAEGCALRAGKVSECVTMLEQLIARPDELRRLQANAERIACPDAARRIIEEVICDG